MNDLEQVNNEIINTLFSDMKYMPFEGAFENFLVIVCGKTDTALRWAKKFLQHGFKTAIQFEEIPEELLPYRVNLRYKSDDFKDGDNLIGKIIVAIATGDQELDQVLASKFHYEGVDLIMSETPARYVNIRFPEDNTKLQKINNELTNNKEKPIIKIGIFEDDLKSRLLTRALDNIQQNFPDFTFEKVILKPYNTEKYNLNYYTVHTSLQDEINISYDRGFNALFKENVDLILVYGSTIPGFYSPDIEFWPTLVKRIPNDTLMLVPKDKDYKTIYDWPDKQKVFVEYSPFVNEIGTLYYYFRKLTDTEKNPKFEPLISSSNIEKIYKENPDAVVITSLPEFFNCSNSSGMDKIEKFAKFTTIPLAPVTLNGFIVGINRKDNHSKVMEMLKVAAQKVNPEQFEMFTYEMVYKDNMYPYYGHYFDFTYSGAFAKRDDKFVFNAYAENKHGVFCVTEGTERETMEEAIQDMFDFIDEAVLIWPRFFQ